MKQHGQRPDSDTSGASKTAETKEQVKGAIEAGGEKLRQAQTEIAHEREPRWRVLVRGRFLLVAYVIALIVVGLLAFAAHSISVLPGDLPFTRELQESKSPVVFWVLYSVSAVGFALPSAIIEIVAVLVLWLLRLRLEAVFLVFTLLADLLGGILKIVVGRHRPTPDLVHVVQQIQQPSFPSGHTLHYTVFYGFLIFVVATNFKPSWPRTVVIVVFALLIALVGLSRVYLGEHWPTDVLGGYLIGALCLTPLIAGYLWAKAHLVINAAPPWIRRTPPTRQPSAAEKR